jgi:hypothetical protein
MRVFIAYAYRESDRWIEELVFPLVQAFGGVVVTGGALQGEQVSEGVRREIEGCDGLIAFLTRRDPAGPGRSTTHRYVVEELATAREKRVNVVEVREEGVDPQPGMLGDLQHITYDETRREDLLVELATVLGRWSRALPTLMLLPGPVVDEIFPLLSKPDFTCECTFLQRGREQAPETISIVPMGGGLFAFPRPPDGALVRLKVRSQGRSWSSSFVGWDAYGVELRPEDRA